MDFWHIVLDAVIDTAKILPILFIVYYLIELFEFKFAKKIQNNRLLKGNLSPIFGSLVGCVPQCGFSVVSADLFTKRIISVGALVAVFIATSDEAFPLMLTNLKSTKWLFILILVKVLFAIVVGYLALWLYKLIFKKQAHLNEAMHNHANEKFLPKHTQNLKDEQNKISPAPATQIDEHEEIELAHGGCCHHHVETKSFDWLHPLLHCLKIAVFVLVVNLIFGIIVGAVGQGNLTQFLNASKFAQPVLACLIGFIPNCASSVVLTQLFVMGGLKFGALVAGLCVNAGLGMIVLLKQNKNVKENLFVLAIISICSIILGYALIMI